MTRLTMVSGTHYAIGLASGQALAGAIAANLRTFWAGVAVLGLARDEVLAWTVADAAAVPPHLREEIQGLADGSHQPYEDLLAYNLYRGGLACDC